MIVLYIMSSGTPEENLKQIFRVFDINNDGKISLKELQKIVRDLFLLLNETGIVKASQDAKASQEILVKTGKWGVRPLHISNIFVNISDWNTFQLSMRWMKTRMDLFPRQSLSR